MIPTRIIGKDARDPGLEISGRTGEKPFLLVLPVLVFILAFTLFPLLYSLNLSLRNFVLTQPWDTSFVGLRNFKEVVTSEYFAASLSSTLRFAFTAVITVLVYGITVGLLMDSKLRTSRILQVLILIPWAIPATVAGIMWKWIFHSDYGALNAFLVQTGFMKDYYSWFSTPSTARVCLAVAHVWKEGSLAAVLILAGLQTIPKELRDAVYCDGGGPLTYFRYVVLPFLKPTLLVISIYETMIAILAFDLVYVMTGGGPGNATALISWYAYIEAFRFLNFGHGTALSFAIASVILLFILAYMRALRTDETY
ncbi:MAG: carbohydrate ABC transporter permease [Alphaproteobacteria bacterium]|jgi:ABC-type sugar transport system permease subunit